MIGSISDVAHHAKKAFEQDFAVGESDLSQVLVKAYAEHGGMGVSLMFERSNGFGRGADSKGFTLVNYQRLDTLETRLAIAREAYRIVRDLAGMSDLGPDAMPSPAVTAWVSRVCEELCR